MPAPNDIEERLRHDAHALRRSAVPNSTLHQRIMARAAQSTETRRPHPGWAQQLAVAASLVLFIGAVAFGVTRLREAHLQAKPETAGTATRPPALGGAALVWDGARILLFGGAPSNVKVTNEMWAWDGHAWTRLHPDSPPPPRTDAGMMYDPTHKQVVLFGGRSVTATSNVELNDTWTWDGQAWREWRQQGGPQPSQSPAMGFDQAVGVLLYDKGESWAWTGSRWSRLALQKNPQASYALMAGRLLVVDTEQPQTWQFTEKPRPNWSPASGGAAPMVLNSVMVEDPATGDVIAFGQPGTWIWNGSAWVTAHPLASPRAVSSAAMAYDVDLGLVVLYGGVDANGKVLGEVWTWDGTTWRQR